MRKITFLYLVAFSINSFASDNIDCHSTDPELGDSAQWASKAIDLFAKNKHEQSIKTVDACFKLFSPAAVVMQKDLNAKKMKAPSVGKVNFKEKKKIDANWAVNDVSVALWAKARSHEKMGDIDLAAIIYSQCIFLSHGRAWDPKGWFWSPASDCIRRGRNLFK
ncbi:MAG: hypothetical protein P8P22_02575 [Porticoccaceae bacterium]|nr:hypothetical protein [Porticoccaceae bacterium]